MKNLQILKYSNIIYYKYCIIYNNNILCIPHLRREKCTFGPIVSYNIISEYMEISAILSSKIKVEIQDPQIFAIFTLASGWEKRGCRIWVVDNPIKKLMGAWRVGKRRQPFPIHQFLNKIFLIGFISTLITLIRQFH